MSEADGGVECALDNPHTSSKMWCPGAAVWGGNRSADIVYVAPGKDDLKCVPVTLSGQGDQLIDLRDKNTS